MPEKTPTDGTKAATAPASPADLTAPAGHAPPAAPPEVVAPRGQTVLATRRPYELAVAIDGKQVVITPAGVRVTAAQADLIRAAAERARVSLRDLTESWDRADALIDTTRAAR